VPIGGKREFTIDLSAAGEHKVPYHIGGLAVRSMTGDPSKTLLVVGPNPHNLAAGVPITASNRWIWGVPTECWIVNTEAQAGLTLVYRVFDVGEEVEAGVLVRGLVNASSSQINPATEDTLAKLFATGTPTLYNETMTDANTEYSQALPAGTKKVFVQCRDGTAFRLAFVTGKVATPTEPYLTIPANASYELADVHLTGVTLYFACDSAAKVIEIEAIS